MRKEIVRIVTADIAGSNAVFKGRYLSAFSLHSLHDKERLNLIALSTSFILRVLRLPRRFSSLSFAMVMICPDLTIEGCFRPPSLLLTSTGRIPVHHPHLASLWEVAHFNISL
jgi:hypothetical protein